MSTSMHFDTTCRLLGGRNCPCSVVARIEPGRNSSGTFMFVKIEHVELLDDIRVFGHFVMARGEEVTHRLGDGELVRLTKEAEARYFSELDREGSRSQPLIKERIET